MRTSLSVAGFVTTAALLAAPAARAETMLGFDGNNQLFTIDTATAARVDRGPMTGATPGTSLVAMDYSPKDGKVYVAGVINDGNNFAELQLYSLDVPTGHLTAALGPAPAGVYESVLRFNPANLSMDIEPATGQITLSVGALASGGASGDAASTFEFRVSPVSGGSAILTYADPPTAAPILSDLAYGNGNPSTLFGLDTRSDTLVRLDRAFDYSVVEAVRTQLAATLLGTVRVAGDPLSLQTAGNMGFEISPATGTGYVLYEVDEVYRSTIATIDLGGATAGTVHPIYVAGPADAYLVDVTILPNGVPEPTTLLAGGATLVALRRRRR